MMKTRVSLSKNTYSLKHVQLEYAILTSYLSVKFIFFFFFVSHYFKCQRSENLVLELEAILDELVSRKKNTTKSKSQNQILTELKLYCFFFCCTLKKLDKSQLKICYNDPHSTQATFNYKFFFYYR